MTDFTITKGFDIKLAGAPQATIDDAPPPETVAVYPPEFTGVKLRLLVAEGDEVKRGSELFFDKRNPDLKFRAPAGGTVQSIRRGERRAVQEIVIKLAADEGVEEFNRYEPAAIASLDRDDVLAQLVNTGYLAYIRQRPFSHFANVGSPPKSIFVNAMNTAPFTIDAGLAVTGEEAAFQAGLDALGRLTDGAVHLCLPGGRADLPPALTNAANVTTHTFSGPHPSGNTSVHIARVDPMKPTDVVWYASAADVVLIGKLFLEGALPTTRIVAVGGSGVKAEARKHYRMRLGAALGPVFGDQLADGNQRVINGSVFAGEPIAADSHLRFYGSSITVIPEGGEREMLGWLAPGDDKLSFTRSFLSTWKGGHAREWAPTTSRNGGHRAIVLSGHYDKVMPLNIMTDFFVKAVLTKDYEEAVKLGILETDPEDFALCEFICPCKTEIQAAVRESLAVIEKEGF